jgi:predicted GTPase
MPTFENFTEAQSIKMLYMGNTGAGKTGSICALAAAGYNVRVLDLDKGVERKTTDIRRP